MNKREMLAVAALAGGTLCLEGALTRLLAVAQFYHFAFLVISLALLGFAASGTLLSLSPSLRAIPVDRLLALCGIAFALSTGVVYLATNYLPFDSFSIAIDSRQVVYFALYYLALSLPFLFGGLGIGAALARGKGRSHAIYAANLTGSAAGVILSVAWMSLAGVPGALLGSALVGSLPALCLPKQVRRVEPWLWGTAICIWLLGGAGLAAYTGANLGWRSPLGISISPYKGLAYARLYPDSRLLLGRWNAISRLDLVANAGTRALPGLSYAYPDIPPEQLGMSIDADDLSPATLTRPEDFAAAAYLPEAVAFALRPGSSALVLEPGAGLGVLQALAGEAVRVTAVLSNRLVAEALERAVSTTNPYSHPDVNAQVSTARQFLEREDAAYNLIYLPLTDTYKPVTSGAYSLHETYSLTVEMFTRALEHLEPDGILVATRWLQTPPSESLRLLATLVAALEERGMSAPGEAFVAYRGIQTITVLVQPDGWSGAELEAVRDFTSSRRYDLVWAPDIRPEETNRYNRLPEPADYLALRSLLESPDREGFFDTYPFDVRPARDNHPFFFHFFTWKQTPEILASLGQTWQPFGGGGFLVLLALLILVVILSTALVAAPPAAAALVSKFRLRRKTEKGLAAEISREESRVKSTRSGSNRRLGWVLAYFGMIGLAYLFVEIPLIQRWILLLGHPTYAFTIVVMAVLLFSGLGSALARSRRLPPRAALAALAVCALLTPWLTSKIITATLGWPLPGRLAASILPLMPLGVLMGLPFPLGMIRLEDLNSALLPWAWAVNGCASVIASVLAAILSLASGFNVVLWLGAAAYTGAWGIFLLKAPNE